MEFFLAKCPINSRTRPPVGGRLADVGGPAGIAVLGAVPSLIGADLTLTAGCTETLLSALKR